MTRNRVIERVGVNDTCVDAGPYTNWDIDDLFPGSTQAQLQRFCVLTWNKTFNPKPSDIPSGAITSISHDRVAVVGLGVIDDLESNTLALVDPVKKFGVPFTKKARLTLIDSTPTSASPMTESAFDTHGTRLAGLADAFVCDKRTANRACAADVHSELALGWEEYGTPGAPAWRAPSTGGSVGRISDIATAVVRAVDDWKDARAASPTTVGRLVLNLSLGWHPAAYSTTNKAAAEDAVFSALNYASCNGVLVMAAAGHDDTPIGDAGRKGASLPAAWEAETELSDTDCVTHFGAVNRQSRTSNYRPVVHAVSAVNGANRLSGIARPKSVPRLVAHGEYLTVTPSDPGTGSPNAPISGTSVATVVASSAAAVALSLDPTLSIHDAVDQVWLGGTAIEADSPIFADVRIGSVGLLSRVVNVCATAERVCGISCRTGFDPECNDDDVNAVTQTAPSSATYEELIATGATESIGSCSGSSAQEYIYDSSVTVDAYECPIQQNPSASSIATVMPMPPNQICTVCPTRFDPPGFGGALDLHLIDPFETYDNMTLTVHFDPGTGGSDSYPLESLDTTFATATDVYAELPVNSGWRNVNPGGPPQYIQANGATLSYTGPDGFTYSEPLYLEY